MDRRTQIGFAAAREPGEKSEKAENLLSAAPERERRVQPRRKRRTPDSIEVFESDIAERSRNLLCIIDLHRRALGHGSAGIDHEIYVHLFFRGKHLQQE